MATNLLTDVLSRQRGTGWSRPLPLSETVGSETEFFPESLFLKMLCLERNRAERSGRRLVLMVLESRGGHRIRSIQRIEAALARATRETDIKGWHREGAAIGVIFTEVPLAQTSIVQILSRKVRQALGSVLGEEARELKLSFHVFPEVEDRSADEDADDPEDGFPALFPDVAAEYDSRRLPLLIKRCLDVVGSLLALLILSPVMALIAAAVKLTSPGPVLFRQVRIGQSGRGFTFLKFRSMYTNSDHAVHEAYVKKFIADKTDDSPEAGERKVFKIQSDPRVTRIGRFLRRTSLDELPQFFNVLAGEMSLVGPRPPVPYEFANYQLWHRRRLLAMKPGITGLWQVEGRSRVKFDEMVRMDLAYARGWSIWTDIKILLKTPRAVLGGNGAC